MSILHKKHKHFTSMKSDINKLSDIDYQNPFTVPEGYFEGLTEKVMGNLPKKKVEAPITISMWSRVKPWFYMAGMFVGIFFFIQLLLKSTSADNYTASSNKYWFEVQVSEDEFFDYLEDQLINDGYYDYMYNQVAF